MAHTLLLLLLANACLAEAQVPARPLIERPIVYDYRPPDTLREFMDRADAVVIARVKGARNLSKGDHPRTDYGLHLLRVLKEHRQIETQPTVCRTMGDSEHSDRIIRRFQPGFPPFVTGKAYLLFLEWDESQECFTTVFGPAGVAEIDEAWGLRPLVPHPVLKAFDGLAQMEVERRLAAARASSRN